MDMSAGPGGRLGRARSVERSPALGLTAICLGFLMITLDATIVNVPLGPIVSDVDSSLPAAQCIVNGYMLAFAALLLSTDRDRQVDEDLRLRSRRVRPVARSGSYVIGIALALQGLRV
jgi:hypothetical protein